MPFAPDAFVGTAEYYVKYRPPYPPVLVSDLLARARIGSEKAGPPPAGTPGSARRLLLVDLACGTGRVALALAGHFHEVWAVDIEPEMLAAARTLDARRPRPHPPIHWIQAAAETFAPPEPVDLIAIGDAFHRLDQATVAAQALKWLKPGGALAAIGNYSFMGGPAPWQQRVSALMGEFIGRPVADQPRPPADTHPNADVFLAAGLVDVATHSFDVPQEWTPETLVGFLHSTSVCSHHALGPRAGEFEARLRRALAAEEPAGIFREVARYGYTFGRKPAWPRAGARVSNV